MRAAPAKSGGTGEDGEPILRGIFRYLVQRGMPLTVRDYLDAVRALRAGFGFGDRSRLEALCRALWARNDEESRLLDRLFTRLPPPSEGAIADWNQALGGPEPPVDEPGKIPGGHLEPLEPAAAIAESKQKASVRFEPVGEPGIGVPSAPRSATSGETFVLNERPPVAVRSMILAWRRFQRPLRSGPRDEIDVGASIQARSRCGFLAAPVQVPRRRNQARLTLLVDHSPSMAPWRRFTPTFLDALERSRLRAVGSFYFDNVPEDGVVFRGSDLSGAVELQPVIASAAGPLLVISDAGAARGGLCRRRVRDTTAFLERSASTASRIAWLNPMPCRRWRDTSAEAIDRVLGGAMFPLDGLGLTAAIDFLRGLRESR